MSHPPPGQEACVPTLLAGQGAAGPTLDSSQEPAVRCPWVRAPGQDGKVLAPRHRPRPWSFETARGRGLTWGSPGLRRLLAAQGARPVLGTRRTPRH